MLWIEAPFSLARLGFNSLSSFKPRSVFGIVKLTQIPDGLN